MPSSNFDPQLPFAVVAFIPGLTERLRRCCRGVVNVVTKPLTLLTMFLKKAKSQLASPGGEIYVRHCTTCRMAYFGETGRTAVDRNRQHDHAIASGAVKSSALAWHAVKYKHYDFEDPLVLRRVAFLRKRRFLESLFGHLCPPSLSINADCDRALSGDGRAPGLLWKIDPGWVIVGLNHHLLDVALERASLPRGPRKRLCLFPPPPVPFITLPKPKVKRWVPLCPSFTVGSTVWVVFNDKVYKATLTSVVPFSVRYSNGSTETDVPSWSIKPFSSVKPKPWTETAVSASTMHSSQDVSGASSCLSLSSLVTRSAYPSVVAAQQSSAQPRFAPGKTTCLDLCKDPFHSERWLSKPACFKQIRSQRFVLCSFFRCRMCCVLHRREHGGYCPYHQS